MKVYVNGKLKKDVAYDIHVKSEDRMTIGCINCESCFFNGVIEDVSIYKEQISEE